MAKKYSLVPFVILTTIYFIVGFLTTVNGQMQAPLSATFLSEVETLRNTLITLIPFFFFLGYLLNSSRAGGWINSLGYKRTLLRGLGFMLSSLLVYLCSAYMASSVGEQGVSLAGDFVPYGYMVFLLGSYLMGTSAAVLQVVINPYIASYELPNTQPVQRVNIVCAINSFGTTIAPFFVTGVIFSGLAFDSVASSQLIMPFLVMSFFVAAVILVTRTLSLPDIQGSSSSSEQLLTKSVWSFSHLRLGVIAIFFYVGAEVCIGVNVNLHAIELAKIGEPLSFFGRENIVIAGLDLGIPALLATLYWGGLMVGRLCSSFLNHLSARFQLVCTSVSAIVLTIIAILTNNLWVLVSVGLCHSIMWGAVFTLAVKDLGIYTSKASGVFMMGVFGGAVFPLVQGFLADKLGAWQYTWSLVIVCEVVILYYAVIGSRIRNS
ncbi:MAG: MFS transporter [Rikenellaceae bacterium]